MVGPFVFSFSDLSSFRVGMLRSDLWIVGEKREWWSRCCAEGVWVSRAGYFVRRSIEGMSVGMVYVVTRGIRSLVWNIEEMGVCDYSWN